MRLSEGRVELDLEVVGYPFPHLAAEPHDADWLFVRLCLRVGERVFERTDPAVLTWELAAAADWLDEIATHVAVFGGWRHGRLSTAAPFIEPNLGLEASSGHPSGAPVTLRVHLGAEFLSQDKALDACNRKQQARAAKIGLHAGTFAAPWAWRAEQRGAAKQTGAFASCAAARAAGRSPLLRGQPGYSERLDGDGDGRACE